MDLVVWEVHEDHTYLSQALVTPEFEYDWNIEGATLVAALPALETPLSLPRAALSPPVALSPTHECPLVHPPERHADLRA